MAGIGEIDEALFGTRIATHRVKEKKNRLAGMQLEREAMREYLRKQMGHIPQARNMMMRFLNEREAAVLTGHVRISDTECLCGCPVTHSCSCLGQAEGPERG